MRTIAETSGFGARPLDGAGAGIPTVVTNVTGMRFGARLRSHTVFTDQSLPGGGTDSAPSPVELLGAALGSCIAFYVREFCLARRLEVEGMRVEVQQRNGKNPARVAEFHVLIVLATELPSQYAAVLDRVVRGCPVYNTLACGATIDVDVTTLSAISSHDFEELADCRGN